MDYFFNILIFIGIYIVLAVSLDLRELDEFYKESSEVWSNSRVPLRLSAARGRSSKGKGERGKAVFSPFNL